MDKSKFELFINDHPKESLQMVVILLFLIWQTVTAIIGVILYCILIRRLGMSKWQLLVIGIAASALGVIFKCGNLTADSIQCVIHQGFMLNKQCWYLLGANRAFYAQLLRFTTGLYWIVCFSPLLAGMLGCCDYIDSNPFDSALTALKHGEIPVDSQDISDKRIVTIMKKLQDDRYDATVLGVSILTGDPVLIPDRYINQVMLVLGTTGAGKTVTLRRFYQRAIRKNYPLIIVDGKPDVANINWVRELTEKSSRPFYGFNCGNYLTYDPLANGSYTELKDKIICLKDNWESDYYRSIAEDYLQTVFEVLLANGNNFDLKQVSACLIYSNLKKLTLKIKDVNLLNKVRNLEEYDKHDITGLQAHLNILINSELGSYFEKNEKTFSLMNVIKNKGIAYFALPALRFPSFSKVLGKLVINDIKAVIDSVANTDSIFTVFDEFSVFAGEQVLNLVNMGRGKGLHAVFGTQGLPDLDRVDPAFRNQVLNCVNNIICHRLNDQDSAESISKWIGTRDGFTLTAQLNGDVSMGSVRSNREFIIHPDAIKQQLKTGEAFYVSKVDGFRWGKVRVRIL